MSRIFALLLALIAHTTCLAATEVINLGFRTSDEILPIAEAMLGNEGRVRSYGNQLMVTASEAKISELRELISQLDTAPKRLLISVDNSQSGFSDNQGFQVNAGTQIGNTQININDGQRRGQNNVQVIQRSTTSRNSGTQQVHATEGFPALIQAGQSVPMNNVQFDAYGRPYQQTQYQDVTQGFYATARVRGDQVQVEISSHNNRLSNEQKGVINTQSSSTVVSGKLGEWITIGQISDSSNSREGGLARRYSTTGRDNLSTRIKVDLID